MGTLVAILISFFDPIRLVITLAVSLCSRQKWIIPVAAMVSAIVIETLLTSMDITRTWGEGILLGMVASGIQALMCYGAVGEFQRWRKKARSGSGR